MKCSNLQLLYLSPNRKQFVSIRTVYVYIRKVLVTIRKMLVITRINP